MKEIGEKLRAARESIGVSIEEASTDLKVTVKQLENVENGNIEAFKDVLNLKYLIRDYSKYLGLDKEDIIDEYNEYLFDYTSKISLDDIKNAKKKKVVDKKKIRSPYTLISERKKCNFTVLAFAAIIILSIIIISVYYIDVDKKKSSNLITYAERG